MIFTFYIKCVVCIDYNVLIIVIILFPKWTLGIGKDVASKFYHDFLREFVKMVFMRIQTKNLNDVLSVIACRQ